MLPLMWLSETQAGVRTGALRLSALARAAKPARRVSPGNASPWKIATLVFLMFIVENYLSLVEKYYPC
jgi:hypothetical protein